MINQLKTITQLNTSGRLDQLMGMSGDLTDEEWRMLLNMLQDEISMVEESSVALSYVPHIAGLSYAISYHHLSRYLECSKSIYNIIREYADDDKLDDIVPSECESMSQDDMYTQGERIVKLIADTLHRDDPYFGLVQIFTTIALNELEEDTVAETVDDE